MDVNALIENFRRVVTNHYFDFNGRASRAEFWQYILVYLVIAVVVGFLAGFVGLDIIADILALALLLPTIGISVRRLHDIGKSGWLVLLPAIPAFLMAFFMYLFWPLAAVLALATIACSLYLLYLYLQPGTTGPNEYGPDPRLAPAISS